MFGCLEETLFYVGISETNNNDIYELFAFVKGLVLEKNVKY